MAKVFARATIDGSPIPGGDNFLPIDGRWSRPTVHLVTRQWLKANFPKSNGAQLYKNGRNHYSIDLYGQ